MLVFSPVFLSPTSTTYLLNSEPFESKLHNTPFFIPKYLRVYFLKLRMFSSKATVQLSTEIIIGSPLSSLRWRCDVSPSFLECFLRFWHDKKCLAHPVLSQPLMELDHFMFFWGCCKRCFCVLFFSIFHFGLHCVSHSTSGVALVQVVAPTYSLWPWILQLS